MGYFYNPPPPFVGGAQPLAPKVSVPDALSPVVGPQLSGRAIALFATVMALWAAPDPLPFMGGRQPLQARTLPPALLDVPVNNPPFSSRRVPVAMWSVSEVRPQSWKALSPGIPGQSVDNPPALRAALDLATAWRDPSLPLLSSRYVIQASIEVAAQPTITAWLGTVLQSWQPVDLRFDRLRQLPPAVTAVAVNDPPFSTRNPWLPGVLVQWRPVDPQPWQPFFVSASWNETPIPPVGGGQLFTVSGPVTQDLFGPTVGVSYTWSGASHRTV